MLEIKCYASGSSGNFYSVDDGRTKIFLDCGLPFKEMQRHTGFTVKDAAGVLVTHEHKDHSKAVKDILARGIDCFMSKGTATAANLEIGYVPWGLKLIRSQETVNIGSWQVTAFDVQHDAAEPLGFLLDNGKDRILYATDTYYLKYRFPNCTVMMVECNHSYEIIDKRVDAGELSPARAQRLVKSHFSLENLLEFFKANDLSKVREIYLLHLSDENSDEELFKKRVAEATGKPVIVA